MPRRPTLALTGGERAFLLAGLFHEALDPERLGALARLGLDWARLEEAARRLGLGAFLFNAVRQARQDGAVPPEVLGRLQAAAMRNAARNALFARAARDAQEVLAAAGVSSLGLKGTALAHFAPRHFALRAQLDVDLLVRPQEGPRAAALLREAGFRPHRAAARAIDHAVDGRSVWASEQPVAHHLPPLVSPAGVTVELHQELPGVPDGVRDGVWARAVRPPAPGAPVTGAADLLGILCAHVFVHHAAAPRYLLRHVADVHALLAAGAPLEEAARVYGGAVRSSVAYVEETARAVERPGGLRARGGEAALAPWWWLGTRLRLAIAGQRARLRSQLRSFGRFGARAVFPSPRFMADRYGVAPRSPLLPLTYLWRPVRALVRLVLGR